MNLIHYYKKTFHPSRSLFFLVSGVQLAKETLSPVGKEASVSREKKTVVFIASAR